VSYRNSVNTEFGLQSPQETPRTTKRQREADQDAFDALLADATGDALDPYAGEIDITDER